MELSQPERCISWSKKTAEHYTSKTLWIKDTLDSLKSTLIKSVIPQKDLNDKLDIAKQINVLFS